MEIKSSKSFTQGRIRKSLIICSHRAKVQKTKVNIQFYGLTIYNIS